MVLMAGIMMGIPPALQQGKHLKLQLRGGLLILAGLTKVTFWTFARFCSSSNFPGTLATQCESDQDDFFCVDPSPCDPFFMTFNMCFDESCCETSVTISPEIRTYRVVITE
jgi:hypothetical protein